MRKQIFIITILIALITASCGTATSTAIQASGQIEAKEITVSPELSGRVVKVLVDEGDSVKKGEPVLRLDDSLLLSEKQAIQSMLDSANANVRAAQATLDSAKAQYDLTLSLALAEEPRDEAWKQSKPSEYDQAVWYFSKVEKIQSAQNEVNAALDALDNAQTNMEETSSQAGSSSFLEIEKALSDMRVRFDVAKVVFDNTNGASDGTELRDAAQAELDDAKIDLEDAQKDYDDALTTDGAKDVLEARAKVEVARERYYASLDALHALQTGENSLLVVASSKAVDQAQALVDQAQAAVSAAQANLDLINTQLDKLTVLAPMNGVVLVRSIEEGEVIQAGSPAMTIGNLESLTVTVYIPETEYGQISVGDDANLITDSFADETFNATVTRIANQAEFTPQNVQTKEGRQTTVYAVELLVNNVDGKLKPGMPVDVTFASGQ